MSTKTCTKLTCSQINPQPIDQFHKLKTSADGHGSICKDCAKQYGLKYHKEGNGLDNYLKWKFGITKKQYEIMLKLQTDRCQLCLRHKKEFRQRFSVDHDHKTGEVRSLLCAPCNQALGLLKDNPDLCRRAADYLEYHFQPPIPYSVKTIDGILVKEDRDDHLPPLSQTPPIKSPKELCTPLTASQSIMALTPQFPHDRVIK